MPAAQRFVFLVPGFFGFDGLGELQYFAHVREHLVGTLSTDDEPAPEVVLVDTSPTASLPRRASRLAHALIEVAGATDGPIHIIGHSSGGLDARLLATPDVNLDEGWRWSRTPGASAPSSRW